MKMCKSLKYKLRFLRRLPAVILLIAACLKTRVMAAIVANKASNVIGSTTPLQHWTSGP
jgi:hypothetical protein